MVCASDRGRQWPARLAVLLTEVPLSPRRMRRSRHRPNCRMEGRVVQTLGRDSIGRHLPSVHWLPRPLGHSCGRACTRHSGSALLAAWQI